MTSTASPQLILYYFIFNKLVHKNSNTFLRIKIEVKEYHMIYTRSSHESVWFTWKISFIDLLPMAYPLIGLHEDCEKIVDI